MNTTTVYGLAADLVLILHFVYVGFTIGGAAFILLGGVFHWDWVKNRIFRLIHFSAVLLVAVEALIGVWCPLTVWEWRLRGLAGQAAETDISFVGRLIRKIIFIEIPDWGFTLMYVGFAVIVLLAMFLVPMAKSPAKQSKDRPESSGY